MFKGKVYLYKNDNGKEEKVEKEFNREEDFDQYIESNEELKKLDKQWKELSFPNTFEEMKKMMDDFDLRLFGESERKGLFEELDQDFKSLFNKTKKLIGGK